MTAPLFSSRLFDYGTEHGDGELPRSLDVGKQVQLSRPLNFLGEEFSTVYVRVLEIRWENGSGTGWECANPVGGG